MLAPARSPEGAVCCIMACWMLPTPPLPRRGAAGAPRAPGAIAPRAGARRVPPRPAAAGGAATARRGHRGAAPLTCRPARGPEPPQPRGGPAAPPAPEPPAGSARLCHGRSARPWARPFSRAVPRRSRESPCPAGWDVEGRGKAGGGEELFWFLLPGSCGRWCSNRGVKGTGGTAAKVTLPGGLAAHPGQFGGLPNPR